MLSPLPFIHHREIGKPLLQASQLRRFVGSLALPLRIQQRVPVGAI